LNHTQRTKQQKSNLDKLDKILANLPEAQYDHSEEETSAKKAAKTKKSSAVKKAPKKETAKNEAAKKVTSEEKKGWSWNKKKRGRPTSASKNPPLKIIPLGGLGEIGKNLTVYEYENEIIIVDCGMAFPDEEMLGIDLVIPDFSYLEENRDKIKGLFITHGHEDHIGAVPYLLQKLNIPVFATRFSMALIENKLAEKNLLSSAKLNIVKPGDIVAAGIMSVEFIYVNHSIPDSCALAIHTPQALLSRPATIKLITPPQEEE